MTPSDKRWLVELTHDEARWLADQCLYSSQDKIAAFAGSGELLKALAEKLLVPAEPTPEKETAVRDVLLAYGIPMEYREAAAEAVLRAALGRGEACDARR